LSQLVYADIRSTIEVHGDLVYIVFVKDGQPIWRLEVVGEKAITKAVGTLGQSLQNVSEIEWVVLMVVIAKTRSRVYTMVLSEWEVVRLGCRVK
jgi:hypothetical protein